MCEQYLKQYHCREIYEILEDPNVNKNFSINIDFLEVIESNSSLCNNIIWNAEKTLNEWNNAIQKIQIEYVSDSDKEYLIKPKVNCRVYRLPACPELNRFPKNEDANKFLQVSGTVIRMTCMKLLEYKRQYICLKCKSINTVKVQFDLKNTIKPPTQCQNLDCGSTNFTINAKNLNSEFCKDYQEIKIQEIINNVDNLRSKPKSIWVVLEDDLVDFCKPGDNIIVCGIIKIRSGPLIPKQIPDMELVIKANHIKINNSNNPTTILTPELKEMFKAFWISYSNQSVIARNFIVNSICPQIFGMYRVKLAMAVVLAGGSRVNNAKIRSEPHLLLVGDPGTGKSELLKFASKIIPRSVLTTGTGTTAAGLTVTALMENGEWQLEAGALVLADGGICCIDEFSSMKEHDRISIHEAMEQQTISVAKAGIVCKLSTKCSILAATNPKGNMDLSSQNLSMNTNLATPLLSRFDLILFIKDKINVEWDVQAIKHVLSLNKNDLSNIIKTELNWTVGTLQAYFTIIRKLNPILTNDSSKILKNYYKTQRRINNRHKARTTVRLLDSLVRLSQGHAKLMYHSNVEIIDAVVAVMLVELTMQDESSVFGMKFDIQDDFPQDPMEDYKQALRVVLNKLELSDLLEKGLAELEQNRDCLFIADTQSTIQGNCSFLENEEIDFKISDVVNSTHIEMDSHNVEATEDKKISELEKVNLLNVLSNDEDGNNAMPNKTLDIVSSTIVAHEEKLHLQTTKDVTIIEEKQVEFKKVNLLNEEHQTHHAVPNKEKTVNGDCKKKCKLDRFRFKPKIIEDTERICQSSHSSPKTDKCSVFETVDEIETIDFDL